MDDYEYGIPDPDYGVFGDADDIKLINFSKFLPKGKRISKDEGTSRNFNRAMIDLYNSR